MSYNIPNNILSDNEFKPGYKYNLNFTFTKDSRQEGGDPIFGDEIIFGSSEEPWDNQSTVTIDSD